MEMFLSFEVMTTLANPSGLGSELIKMSREGLLLLKAHRDEVCGRVRGSIDDARTVTHHVRPTEGPYRLHKENLRYLAGKKPTSDAQVTCLVYPEEAHHA